MAVCACVVGSVACGGVVGGVAYACVVRTTVGCFSLPHPTHHLFAPLLHLPMPPMLCALAWFCVLIYVTFSLLR